MAARTAALVAADILDPPRIGGNLRPGQRPPPGDWRVWLLHPGRGWGKGFAASHWIASRVRSGKARSIALVGSTQGHVRQLMIESPASGLLRVCPEATYQPSRAEVSWPNGARAYVCSAERADVPPLRGGNFDCGWADELDSWGLDTTNAKAATAWANLVMSVRLGDARMVVTSTPKPGRMVAALLARARDDGDVAVTTGERPVDLGEIREEVVERAKAEGLDVELTPAH